MNHVGFLIKNDGISALLRESEFTGSAHGTGSYGVPETFRSTPMPFRARFGRVLWIGLHGMSERWPCSRCGPSLTLWMQGLHDAVNVRRGKRPFRPDAFATFASGSLEGAYHRGCFGCRLARGGSRLISRAPQPSKGLAPMGGRHC